MTGEQLKALRLSLGLTVAQAAIACDIDSSDIRWIERGHLLDFRRDYESGLNVWQAAGERKDAWNKAMSDARAALAKAVT